MSWCRLHSARLHRVWRLPSVRTIAATMIVTVAVAALSGRMGPPAAPAAVLALGATVVAVTACRHRHRIVLEAHMVRALVRSGRGCPGSVHLPGLGADVHAEAMPDGVTRIDAASWLDAVRALGFVMARDRGFQLDWLRRVAAGRLSEVWGSTALAADVEYRTLGLAAAAGRALERLDREERDLLQAFAAGVTASWEQDGPPFECRFLTYRPEPWTPADSLSIALLLFHGLSWKEQSKRAEAVIRRVFPEPVARFLTPVGAGGDQPPPEGLGRFRASVGAAADVVAVDSPTAGSTCWIQATAKGPVLCCDLHLPLSIPNPMYEVDLGWSGMRVRGLMAVGLPVVLTGTNGRLAWGVTNLNADVLDLVPASANGGRAPAPVAERERIAVRQRPDTVIEVARAGGALVSPTPLLGETVAIRWTGYDPRACDLRLQRLAHATTIDESIALLDRSDGIALNVLVADESGRMAHLATGLIPRRRGPCAESDGYLGGVERPRRIDPRAGALVSANDAALPEQPFRIGFDVDAGYRARRVRCLLAEGRGTDAAALHAMLHDTRAELYVPYRDLAVAALRGVDDRLATILAEWNGHADASSRAFAVLVRLRAVLARRVLSPYLAACLERDPQFRYAFHGIDRPVLAIVRSGDPSLLPPGAEGDGWNGFVARCVDEAAAMLGRSPRRGTLPAWGEINRVGLRHPLETLAPWASALLGVAARPQAGALHCVRTCVPGFSTVGRAVLRPGPAGGADFETPAGQSGHPLSRHYDDRHDEWSGTTLRRARRSRRGCRFVLRATGGTAHVTDVAAR